MKVVYTFLFVLFSFHFVMSQIESQVIYEELLIELLSDIKNGQHRTIRDIISLLDKPVVADKARTILKNHTFFTEKEIDVLRAEKTDLLGFYYDHAEEIIYSEILNAFYITPIEKTDVSFELKQNNLTQPKNNGGKLRRLLTDLNSKLEVNKFEKAEKIVNQIIELKNIDQEVFMNILRDSRLLNAPESVQKNIYQKLVVALQDYPDLELVEIALQMVEAGFLDEEFVSPFLKNITNNSLPLDGSYENAPEYYMFLVDSLSSLEQIRSYGYEKLFNSRVNFFQFPVDYYGKVLALSDKEPWIKRNIIFDLKQTQHPRSFFYIVSDLYRNLKVDSNYQSNYHLETIESMTNVKIGVKNKFQMITFNPLEDEVSLVNYFLYWAVHSEDFEWDENRGIFTNKLETLAKTQNYERLFRRLNSKNDTIALESFVQLTNGEPLEIKSLAKKYRQLLRNQNNSLPSLKYQYLEQLSLLTEYCRQNNIQYQVKNQLAKKLKKLLVVESEIDRYAIENEIIESLNVNEITAFEYWACLKEGDKNLSYSVGRILDWVYAKNWDKILQDKDQVRLFLKKSFLFENIGVSGLCNIYLNKFNPKDKNQQIIFEEIGKIESDEDILNQVSMLLTSDTDDEYNNYSIVDFLDDPLIFNRRDIKVLPAPTKEDVKEIVTIIKKEQEPEIIKKLFSYLWQHPEIDFIPYLFELIDDERIVTKRNNLTVSVADNIIPIVENVYSHSFDISPQHPFATAQWRDLWKSDGSNFEIWEERFFEEKLDSLQYYEKLKIDDLNLLTESGFYSEKYKVKILDNLKKVKPIRNIRRLSIEPKLSVEEDLHYFQDFYFNYKELDDIPKLFEINEINVEILLKYIEQKSATFEASEKGSLYNNLFRAPWLSRYVNQGKLNLKTAKNIELSLEKYLYESEFLSEFEEQTTQLNIAQLQFMGKSIQEKIDATLVLDADNSSKVKILKSIIATIDYEDIGLVVERSDGMTEILKDKTYTFLSQDFGIPVFSFNTMKEQNQFIRNHSKMSAKQFYAHYLKKFGLNIYTKKGQLDFQEIYTILHFDIVTPFVGETGGKRDLYIYGVVKLLELHFNNRLGFHEKLNESQTFYSFSSTKRANAWIAFLESEKLVIPNPLLPLSFNQLKEEN